MSQVSKVDQAQVVVFQHVYGVATSLGSMGCVVESMEAGDVYGSHSGSFFVRVELRLPGQRIRCCVVSMLVCGEHRVSFDGDGRIGSVSYTHLRAHETDSYLVCRLLLEKKKKQQIYSI